MLTVKTQSWADEVEVVEEVERMEGPVRVIVNGVTKYWKKEDALDSLKRYAPENLYCAWGRGHEVADKITEPLKKMVDELDSVADIVRNAPLPKRGACSRATEKECLALSEMLRVGLYRFVTELETVVRAAEEMMFPIGDVNLLLPRLVNIAEEHVRKLESPRPGVRSKVAARLWQACLERERAYCVHASAIVALARIEVKAGMRKLILFRIEFDREYPDVAALMGR